MKKIVSIAIVAMMIIAVMALPASAASTNAKVSISYLDNAPDLDGVVTPGEYKLAIHSSKDNTDEFDYSLDTDKSIDSEFYMAWDDSSLYMAWVVKADGHYPIPVDYDGDNDGTKGTETDYKYMWKFSCVQFMLSTGAPNAATKTYQTGVWGGNYLEVGLSVMADGSSYKVAWSKPTGGENLTPDDWDFMGVRDEANKTTTYEVRIDWNKSGISKVGNDVQFGLTYAVADQEFYGTDGEGASMLEWQDAILGSKNMDAGAIITLTGKADDSIVDVSLDVGDESLPAGGFTVPEGSTQLAFDDIGASINVVETITAKVVLSSILVEKDTLPSKNLKDSLNILLRPVDGEDDTYAVVSSELALGVAPTFADFKDGDIVIAFDKTSPSFESASNLIVGDEIVFLGYDLAEGKLANTDALAYATRDLSIEVSATSETESEEDSATESDDDSKAATSTAASVDNTSKTTDDSGSSIWIILAIVVVVAIGGGAAYFFLVVKKKK